MRYASSKETPDMPSSEAITKLKAFTYRVECIPAKTTEAELITKYFHTDDQGSLEVKSLCPSVDSVQDESPFELTATVLFRPPSTQPQSDGPRTLGTITIDKGFGGFTPLYVPPRESGPVAADIIAVTGLAGHALGSWAHSDDDMWLRDYLPRYASNARILTYGYPSELRNDSSYSTIQDHTRKFVHDLVNMRDEAQCESRPLIFIGHSLGCLIIKKALTDAPSFNIDSSRLPTRTIIFLAAPHKGLEITALRTLVAGKPSQRLINELESGSSSLTDLNNRFKQIAYGIDILTFYERKPTKTVVKDENGNWSRNGEPVLMVTQDSAELYYQNETSLPVDCDHSRIAKLMRGQAGIFPNVRAAIRKGLRPTAALVAEGLSTLSIDARSENTSPVPTDAAAGAVPTDESPAESDDDVQTRVPPNDQANTTCEKCRVRIPDSTFHFGCPSCLSPRKKNKYFCHSCYSGSWVCSEHETGMCKMIVKSRSKLCHHVIFVSSQVDRSDSDLVRAIKQGDVGRLRKLANGKGDFNERNDTNSIALHLAAQLGRSKCARILLEHGTSGEARGVQNNTPLLTAIEYDHMSVVRVLLEHRVSLENDGGFERSTPLTYAAMFGQTDIVDLLLRHNARTDPSNAQPRTPLREAVRFGATDSVRLLLNSGANVNSTDTYENNTPLHSAAHRGNVLIADMLLSAGATLDSINKYGETPLHILTACKAVEIATLLLTRGANPNIRKKYGNTPLHAAVRNDNADLVNVFVNFHSDLKIRNERGNTPLLTAAVNGCNLALEALIRAGADIGARRPKDRCTALILACTHQHPRTVEILLGHGVKVDEVDKKQRTALHLAVEAGYLTICEKLIAYGAAVQTPYQLAIANGRTEIAALLLKHGAKPVAPTSR